MHSRGQVLLRIYYEQFKFNCKHHINEIVNRSLDFTCINIRLRQEFVNFISATLLVSYVPLWDGKGKWQKILVFQVGGWKLKLALTNFLSSKQNIYAKSKLCKMTQFSCNSLLFPSSEYLFKVRDKNTTLTWSM